LLPYALVDGLVMQLLLHCSRIVGEKKRVQISAEDEELLRGMRYGI
jgi:hypothetical protein